MGQSNSNYYSREYKKNYFIFWRFITASEFTSGISAMCGVLVTMDTKTIITKQKKIAAELLLSNEILIVPGRHLVTRSTLLTAVRGELQPELLFLELLEAHHDGVLVNAGLPTAGHEPDSHHMLLHPSHQLCGADGPRGCQGGLSSPGAGRVHLLHAHGCSRVTLWQYAWSPVCFALYNTSNAYQRYTYPQICWCYGDQRKPNEFHKHIAITRLLWFSFRTSNRNHMDKMDQNSIAKDHRASVVSAFPALTHIDTVVSVVCQQWAVQYIQNISYKLY